MFCAKLVTLCVGLFIAYAAGEESKVDRLLIVINCQHHQHHINFAQLSKSYIEDQRSSVKDKLSVQVMITAVEWSDLPDTWTLFSLKEELMEEYKGLDWVMVISEHTEVKLTNLQQLLAQHDSSKPVFLGRALKDKERTITHHYAETDLLYPDVSAGMVLSWALVKFEPKTEPKDFNIDPRHEFALYLYDDGKGTALTDVAEFCAPGVHKEECVTTYSIESMLCPASSTHSPVSEDDIFVIVKTGEVYHETRVPLQQRLWTGKVKNIEIASETADESIPTVAIDAPNTERGHCAKFYAILRRAYNMKHINSKKWLVVVDDDTIMSVSRLTKLLSCYPSDKPVVLGERYGYKAHTDYGYSYITGGGGTVLSMPTVNAIIEGGHKCQKEDDADDMLLGIWLSELDIPVINSPLFHQAPPSAYSPDYINPQKPYAISFHKYEYEEPEMIAREWLGLSPKSTKTKRDKPKVAMERPKHSEL